MSDKAVQTLGAIKATLENNNATDKEKLKRIDELIFEFRLNK